MIFSILTTKKYLLLFLWFNFVLKANGLTAFKIEINKNNKVNLKSLSKLLKILKDNGIEKYDTSSYEPKDIDSKTLNEKEREEKFERNKDKFSKVLIQRLVPHDYKYKGKYEYDNRFKTFYRPLVRFHKNRFVHKRPESTNLMKQRGNFDIINRLPRKFDNFDDGYLLQPFKVKAKDEVTAEGIIEDIKKFTEVNNKKTIGKLMYSILNILEGELKQALRLRSMVYLPSDKLSNLPEFINLQDIVVPDKPKEGLPDYKYWNYWTYDKVIYEDNCKGKLIKWANVCMEPPSN